MIMRAEFWVMVSRTWPAKNTMAVSMIANNSAKNTGATSANSTAAEPRRLRRNRRNIFRNEAFEAAGDGIDRSPGAAAIVCSDIYRKVIVEVFRRIEARCPGALTRG